VIALGGGASGARLPSEGLWLNASKSESRLEATCDVDLVSVGSSTQVQATAAQAGSKDTWTQNDKQTT